MVILPSIDNHPLSAYKIPFLIANVICRVRAEKSVVLHSGTADWPCCSVEFQNVWTKLSWSLLSVHRLFFPFPDSILLACNQLTSKKLSRRVLKRWWLAVAWVRLCR